MVVSFFIYSAATGDPLAGLFPTFNYYKRRNADGSVTDLDDPTISDKGSGRYEFTIIDADILGGSIIDYVVDCTVAAAARYEEDHVRADDPEVADQLVAGSGVETFGITANAVRRHHYPNSQDFSEDSNPTAVTVDEMIDDAAGELAGRLAKESITTDEILALGSTSPAYVQCRKIVRLLAAISIAPAMQADATDTARWQKVVDAFWVRLEDDAATALGNEDLGATASDPDGPTDHIDEYGIDIGDPSTDASSAIPPFRKDDEL